MPSGRAGRQHGAACARMEDDTVWAGIPLLSTPRGCVSLDFLDYFDMPCSAEAGLSPCAPLVSPFAGPRSLFRSSQSTIIIVMRRPRMARSGMSAYQGEGENALPTITQRPTAWVKLPNKITPVDRSTLLHVLPPRERARRLCRAIRSCHGGWRSSFTKIIVLRGGSKGESSIR